VPSVSTCRNAEEPSWTMQLSELPGASLGQMKSWRLTGISSLYSTSGETYGRSASRPNERRNWSLRSMPRAVRSTAERQPL